MSRNLWERHAELVAAAAISGAELQTPKTPIGEKCAVCEQCAGAGLLPPMFNNEWAQICMKCKGSGFNVIARPKQVTADFGLTLPRQLQA